MNYAWSGEQRRGVSKVQQKREKQVGRRALFGAAVFLVATMALAKFGSSDEPDVVRAAGQYLDSRVSIEQVVTKEQIEQSHEAQQEYDTDDLMVYDGSILVKPASTLRSSPTVIKHEDSNKVGETNNDPDKLTSYDKPVVTMDLQNPANGYWFGFYLDGKLVWVNWQNVIEFDKEKIQPIAKDTPPIEEQ
jgi:hypothetical protein